MQQQVTIKYGMDTIQKSMEAPVTIGTIRRDPNIRSVLGYGDQVRLMINGVAMSDDTTVPSGAMVTVETAANTKAVLVLA